jgi:hypothetical protein
LLVNGEDVYVVEVKYRLHLKNIEHFVGRKAADFPKLYPEYQQYRIHFAMASIAAEEDVKRLALE